MNWRPTGTALVTLGLAIIMHLDWHVARPAHHHLSLGWSWHWLLAVPVFALTAWYVRRVWPTQPVGASVAIILVASLLAALVEPVWELWVDGATWEWAFGRVRLVAFAQFLADGTLTQIALLALFTKRVNRPGF